VRIPSSLNSASANPDAMLDGHLSLKGIHVLITRPDAQARPWAEKLQALGASVSLQPMMVIQALADEDAKRQIINRILAFAEYQKAIFISQNAVSYGLQWLDKYWPQLPIDVEFFAIGKATGSLLAEGVERGDIYVATSTMNSEELLSHPRLQAITGEKIIIFRGKGGRTTLAETLGARGALVEYCELYERQCPLEQSQAVDPSFRHTQQHAVLAVHSGETLENLCSIIKADDLLWLKQQAILLPSQRVAEQARKAGFDKRIVADNAGHDSMVKALNEWQQYDRQKKQP
jgi:uroporphyrinogen-III synthase